MPWREDNRGVSNGEQYLMAVNAALAHPVSRQWKGYWQRAAIWAALSRCRTENVKRLCYVQFQAAATASRHAPIAAARSVRWVRAEVRWRWTLKVL